MCDQQGLWRKLHSSLTLTTNISDTDEEKLLMSNNFENNGNVMNSSCLY